MQHQSFYELSKTKLVHHWIAVGIQQGLGGSLNSFTSFKLIDFYFHYKTICIVWQYKNWSSSPNSKRIQSKFSQFIHLERKETWGLATRNLKLGWEWVVILKLYRWLRLQKYSQTLFSKPRKTDGEIVTCLQYTHTRVRSCITSFPGTFFSGENRRKFLVTKLNHVNEAKVWI